MLGQTLGQTLGQSEEPAGGGWGSHQACRLPFGPYC